MKITSTLTLCFLSAALPMSAQTLIFDNFNSANSTDLNADLSRQSGSLAPLSWDKNINGDTQIVNNQLSLGGSNISTDYSAQFAYDFAGNASLTAGGAFQISFDLVTLSDGSYTAFAMTGDSNRPRPAVDDSTEFGLLFRESDDDISIRQGTGSVGSVEGPAALTGTVVMTVTTDAIATSEAYTISMTIAGNPIDLNGAGAGNDFSSTWAGSNMYLSWGSRSGTSVIDNISVTAIPEPSVYALALGALAMGLVIRRRKA